MALAQIKTYTEDDYYKLPEDVRAELIEGQFYDMSAPSRIHQEILGGLYFTIRQYIRSKDGSCRVYPAPFAVKLFADDKTSLNRISVSYAALTSSQSEAARVRRTGLSKSSPRATGKGTM